MVDRCAVETDRAAFGADDPHGRRERRGLPHAVAAEQRHDLAGRDGEIDAEQHPAVAIPGFEPADLKHSRPTHPTDYPMVGLDPAIHVFALPAPNRRRGWPGQARPWGMYRLSAQVPGSGEW